MKYDPEYNSFKFDTRDLEVILDALSYAGWSDKSLSSSDKDFINNLYISIDRSRSNTNQYHT